MKTDCRECGEMLDEPGGECQVCQDALADMRYQDELAEDYYALGPSDEIERTEAF